MQARCHLVYVPIVFCLPHSENEALNGCFERFRSLKLKIPPASVAAPHSRFPCHRLKRSRSSYLLHTDVVHDIAGPAFVTAPVRAGSFVHVPHMTYPDEQPVLSLSYQTGANGSSHAHERHMIRPLCGSKVYNRNF